MVLLSKSNYYKLERPLKDVAFNSLFARFVMENKVDGAIWADNHEQPQTFYVVHPYGMTLLLGDPSNESFNQEFRDYALNVNHTRSSFEWMQTFPDGWTPVLQNLFQEKLVKEADNVERKEEGIVELNTRVNFKFSRNKYTALQRDFNSSDAEVVRITKNIFQEMKGSVVPSNFWRNENDFLKSGAGFSLYYKNQLAATAFSSFVHENQLELGIETVDQFRGHRFATQVCCTLIDYCLEKELEPVWACRQENKGSYQLAIRLGFEPVLKLPYYRLSK